MFTCSALFHQFGFWNIFTVPFVLFLAQFSANGSVSVVRLLDALKFSCSRACGKTYFLSLKVSLPMGEKDSRLCQTGWRYFTQCCWSTGSFTALSCSQGFTRSVYFFFLKSKKHLVSRVKEPVGHQLPKSVYCNLPPGARLNEEHYNCVSHQWYGF